MKPARREPTGASGLGLRALIAIERWTVASGSRAELRFRIATGMAPLTTDEPPNAESALVARKRSTAELGAVRRVRLFSRDPRGGLS